MRIIVDIDGTICTKVKGDDYESAQPIQENIDKINKLHDEGHEIFYWTARGFTTGKDWLMLTILQLNRWGCEYDSVCMGKKQYDLWIDDKALRIEEL